MRVLTVPMMMLVLMQLPAFHSSALGQLPVLRNVPVDSAARPIAPPVVVRERERVPVVVASKTEVVTPPAAPEFSLSGQILRTKQVDVRPSGDKMIAILLDPGDGQRQAVDLGPALNWKNTPLHVGEQIAVRGPIVALGDTRVLVATEARSAGEVVYIARVAPAAATVEVVSPPAGYPIMPEVLKFDARIESLKTVALRGLPETHTVAETLNRRGEVVVVDLGPPAALWRADLKPQEWIRIEGQQMNVNNRPVILALQINKNGVPFLIDRGPVRAAAAALAR
jgi:hypothetical protein